MAPLPQARTYFSAAALNNFVFVFGGNNHFYYNFFFAIYSPGGYTGRISDEIWRFDPISSTWMEAGKLTKPKYDHSVAVAPINQVSDICN